MNPWTVEFTAEAKQELQGLPADMQAEALHIAELLQSMGPERIREPYVKPLEGKLWEMRLRGRDGIARALYFAKAGRRLCVVRVFVKKTQKTPRREIELALRRAVKELADDHDT